MVDSERVRRLDSIFVGGSAVLIPGRELSPLREGLSSAGRGGGGGGEEVWGVEGEGEELLSLLTEEEMFLFFFL